MSFTNSIHVLAALAILLPITGCSKASTRPEVTITGNVTLDDSPLTSGSVQFSSSATGDSAQAAVDAEGKYVIKFKEGDIGAIYDVTVTGNQEEEVSASDLLANPKLLKKSAIPLRYSDRGKSGLKTTITEPGENQYDIVLKSKK
ncbi:hypothetical protein [Planctomicrobium sp. SH527]|uniref:hypothetical protein n=1 Tax=Planctomicrobium sp. SH527 TaxID=3448123 RepID=UPI003F5C3F8D